MKGNIKSYLLLALLAIPHIALADDYGGSGSSISGFWADFYNWLSLKGGGSNGSLATAFANLDRLGVGLIGVSSKASAVLGACMFLLAGIKYVRHSDGKEQVSGAHFTLITSILLIGMMPFLNGISATMGFADSNGLDLSTLARSCTGEMGEPCKATTSSLEAYTSAILIGMTRIFKFVGILGVMVGIYTIHGMGQPGGNKRGWGSAVIFMLAGGALYNLPQVVLAFGNEFYPDSYLVDFMLKDKGRVTLPF